jgi:hypothetical protein
VRCDDSIITEDAKFAKDAENACKRAWCVAAVLRVLGELSVLRVDANVTTGKALNCHTPARDTSFPAVPGSTRKRHT